MRSVIVLLVAFMLVGGMMGESRALNLEEFDNPFGVVSQTLYDEMVELGVVWDRQTAAVWRIEPEPGVWNWGSWDGRLGELESRGLNFAPVLGIGKCWMTGWGGMPDEAPSYPPADLDTAWSSEFGYSASYYDFIYTLVDAYRGRVDHLTIENEANAMNFWAATAPEYVRVLKTAYLAAHDADPDFVIFDSGIASGAWGLCIARDRLESGQYTDEEVHDFWVDYYDRNVYFPELRDFTIQQMVTWIYGNPFALDQYDRVTYILAHMGGALDAMNVKFTEHYWLMDDVVDWIDMRTSQAGYIVDYKCNNEASNWPGVSEAQHARELLQKYVVGLSLGVKRALWFPLTWSITTTPRIALLDSTDQWMETAFAFHHGSRTIAHHFEFDHMDASDPDIWHFVFRHRTNPEHHLRVCWFDDGTHTPGSQLVRFDLPPVTVRAVVSDWRGYRRTAQLLGEDYIDITIDEEPILVEFFQDLSQVTGLGEDWGAGRSRLEQNYPNPFNPTTTIAYHVPGLPGEVREARISIYDLQGRLVRRLVDGPLLAGRHTSRWGGVTETGGSAGPGVYVYEFSSGEVHESRKMILAP